MRFIYKHKKLSIYFLLFGFLFSSLWQASFLSVHATSIDYEAEMEERKTLPVETNQIENWPQGPNIGAQSAILMDADSGTILYAKNIHEHLYPASVTKILTTLIATEECNLNEMVTFSHDAIFSVPVDGSKIALDEGESLSVEECLESILIASANEVSNGLAEHISGSMDAFADLMNKRAKELGCVDSNFVTTNGLHDDKHYTSAYDLAMIGKAFFANELLCKLSSTPVLHLSPSDTQPDDIIEYSKNQLYPGREYSYEYLVGSKTGYTDQARQTLVSCAKKDGMKLICVILKEEAPGQYTDTIDLFNYGFSNFEKINISDTETKYNINNAGFFYSNNDILGNSQPILSINTEDCILLPKTASFSDTVSEIDYENVGPGEVANIIYSYNGAFIGSASVDLANNDVSYEFNGEMFSEKTPSDVIENTENIIFVNVKRIIFWVLGIAGTAILIIITYSNVHNYQFGGRRFSRRNRRRRRKRR